MGFLRLRNQISMKASLVESVGKLLIQVKHTAVRTRC